MPSLTPEQQAALQQKLDQMTPEELREFQKQQCVFCQIVSGKIPSRTVYEDEHCLVVLDINPAVKGHLLIVPKEHYALMPLVPEKMINHLFSISKYLSKALLKGLKCSGTTLFVANGPAAGQRVQHFILHLLPRKEGDGLFNVDKKIIDREMQQKIKTVLEHHLHHLLGVKKEVQLSLPALETRDPDQNISEENTEIKNKTTILEKKGQNKKKGMGRLEPKNKTKTQHENHPEKHHEKVNLDDIAHLFK